METNIDILLRAIGDSKRPLYYLIVCCFINIIMDIILVVIFKMGVAGVAIATLTAQAVSSLLIIRALMNLDDSYKLKLKEIRFHKEIFTSIICIGLPAGLQSIMNSVSGIIMQSSVNMLGTNAMAGNTSYAKLDGIFWMISSAFSVSIATFVGQNYGAEKYSRMRRSIWVCLGLNLIVSGGLSIFFLVFGKYLFYLFTTDTEVIIEGMKVLKAIAPYYAIIAIYEIFTSALRGGGDVIVPMIINILGLCIVRILWVIGVAPNFNDLYYIIITCPISWAITSIAFIFYFGFRYRQMRLLQDN